MLATINSYGLQGIKGFEIRIEVDVTSGLPHIETVGLPDAAVKESKERVRSALKNSGFVFPVKRITVNLAPGDTKKEGALYDLPIALGILAATGQLKNEKLSDYIIIGELSLYGEIRRVRGVLPIIISALAAGCRNVIIPKGNEKEAAFAEGINVYAFSTLKEAADFLAGNSDAVPVERKDINSVIVSSRCREDFKYVKGQYAAKRALEIAAAGSHNVLLIGPPGGGKTMLARCLPSILPDFSVAEALETTKIHSTAGCLDESIGLIVQRPFRTPHHSASRFALSGGGASARPGEISLAHNGVLFLDELPEYPRSALEILRQPLEDGVITISRTLRSVEFPANFMLIASMNPCPCGFYGSEKQCSCTPLQIAKYRSKLSGPLMDRIDLHIEAGSIHYDDLAAKTEGETSKDIKARVNAARQRQLERFKGTGVYANSKMTSVMVNEYCNLDSRGEAVLKAAFDRLGLSARAYVRILKVSRTIADLEGCGRIEERHVAEAVGYRALDRAE